MTTAIHCTGGLECLHHTQETEWWWQKKGGYYLIGTKFKLGKWKNIWKCMECLKLGTINYPFYTKRKRVANWCYIYLITKKKNHHFSFRKYNKPGNRNYKVGCWLPPVSGQALLGTQACHEGQMRMCETLDIRHQTGATGPRQENQTVGICLPPGREAAGTTGWEDLSLECQCESEKQKPQPKHRIRVSKVSESKEQLEHSLALRDLLT